MKKWLVLIIVAVVAAMTLIPSYNGLVAACSEPHNFGNLTA